jgi:hypothetical protein
MQLSVDGRFVGDMECGNCKSMSSCLDICIYDDLALITKPCYETLRGREIGREDFVEYGRVLGTLVSVITSIVNSFDLDSHVLDTCQACAI